MQMFTIFAIAQNHSSMKVVKRRGSSTTKTSVLNFYEKKEQFLLDAKVTVMMEEISYDLIIIFI